MTSSGIQGFRLSPQQRRLWELQGPDPATPYRVCFTIRVLGRVDTELLDRTLADVVQRHEILRTTFTALEGMSVPLQVVNGMGRPPMARVDLTGLPPCRRRVEAEVAFWRITALPFDFHRGPLLLLGHVTLSLEETVLVVGLSALCADSATAANLVAEISDAYHRLQHDRPPAEESLQFPDAAEWQNELLEAAERREDREFWSRIQVQQPAKSRRLPCERPSTALERFEPRTQRLAIRPRLARRLDQLLRRRQLSAKAFYLACWQILIGRLTGETEIQVGVSFDGRKYEELEKALGPFEKYVPLATRLRPGVRFLDLVRQVVEASVQAADHQEYFAWPFAEAAGEQSEFFSVCFRCGEEPPNREDPALEFSLERLRIYTDRFKLRLSLCPGPGRLDAALDYDGRRFDSMEIQRLGARFERLLESVVRHPEEVLENLEVLPNGERHWLLTEMNDTRSAEMEVASVRELFERQAARTPDKIAVESGDRYLSYRRLNGWANQLARTMLRLGSNPGDCVGLCFEPSPEAVVGVLGVLKAGGAYVPLDPSYPVQRLRMMASDAGVGIAVAAPRWMSALSEGGALRIPLELDGAAVTSEKDDNLSISEYPEGLAYVMFTSGSTGRPKGVMIAHRGLTNYLGWARRAYSGSGVGAPLHSPLGFDLSVTGLMVPLLSGQRVVFPDQQGPDGLIAALSADREYSLVKLTPAHLELLDAVLPPDAGGRAGTLVVGGEAFLGGILGRWQTRFPEGRVVNEYGPTETVVGCCAFRVRPGSTFPGQVPIGRPITDTALYTVDRSFRPVAIGTPGELLVGGAGLARGYLGLPRQTAEVFVPDAFGLFRPGARLYRTGDQAKVPPDGDFEFLGRLDNQVKIRGYRIEVGEVEAVLGRHPAVREVVVVTRYDEPDRRRLVAYALPNVSSAPGPDELRSFLERQVPEFMVPEAIVIVDRFPLTANGKVDRSKLPAPEDVETRRPMVAPRTPVEELLVGIWAEVLGLERVGTGDRFTDLGGHSLIATQVVSRIRRAFQVELPLRSLLDSPTVTELARRIEDLRRDPGSPALPPIEPVSRESPTPLSFAQRRLWFLDQLLEGESTYSIPLALRLSGQLHLPALELGLNTVIRRHEALRTNFKASEGEPIQSVRSFEPRALPLVDLCDLGGGQRRHEVERLTRRETRRQFDLASAPLFRVAVLRLRANEHLAVVSMHHIISDAWSMAVLIRELGECYRAALSGRAPSLPDLPIQYADFAAWQHRWLRGETLTVRLAYWKRQLEGVPPRLELPTDRPRPAVQTYRGASRDLTLSEPLSFAVRALSRRLGATLFMTLLAAFKTVVHRYCGQRDLCVGTPVAGRNLLEIEGLIGFFVNTLVLRARIVGDPAFNRLLSQVREVTLEAFAHQDLPFERLVEELQPSRTLDHQPLFQVMFALQNAPLETLELPHLELGALELEAESAKFDVVLAVDDAGARLAGSLAYDAELFDATTIQRLLEHFENILRDAAADPDRPLSNFGLLNPQERHQLSVEWNDTASPLPAETVHGQFEARARESPDALAVDFDGLCWSYGWLNQRADQLASHLRLLGVASELPVGICVGRSPELVVGLLGILKAGGAYVPLDPSQPSQRLAFMIDDAGAEVVLTERRLLTSLPPYAGKTVCLDTGWPAVSAPATVLPWQSADAEALAYIIYTSGSSGRPKGVSIHHRAICRLVVGADYVKLAPGDRVAQASNASFDAATFEIWGALLSGALLVGIPREVTLAPERLASKLVESGISTLFLTTALFNQIARQEPSAFALLRQVLFGGEAVEPRRVAEILASAPPQRLLHVYGPTESTTFASWHPVESVPPGARTLPIGRPISNTEILVLDRGLRPVPAGVFGELCIAAQGLARGYWRRPGLTAEKFVPNTWDRHLGGRLYRTGDLVRLQAAGEIEFLGRLDHQVKLRGFRVELGEIEAALGEHPALREAVVMLRMAGGDRRLVAYVVAEAEEEPSWTELRDFLRHRVPDFMLPSSFVYLESLPLNANGKVDRRALPEPESAGPDQDSGRLPRGPVEEILCGLWAEVLGVEAVGPEDDFFELGGHSLLATQLVSRMRDALRAEIPLRSLFEAPTVEELAREISRTAWGGGADLVPPIEPVPRQGELPLSFAQQRLWFLDQLEPESPAYNLPTALRLSGRLDLPLVHHVIGEIVRRHESLRTRFGASEGKPFQIVSQELDLELPVIDLSALATARRDREIGCRVAFEELRPFNLKQGPLLRLTFLRLEDEEHVALLNMHHIITDGWSVAIFVRELATLYAAYSRGRSSPLPELPIQYGDFAVWQRAWLQGEVLEGMLSYWKERLAGAPAVLDLLVDRPRPAVRTYHGASRRVLVDRSLAAGLRSLSRQRGATLFMTLLAAFTGLLSRYSHQSDVCLGTAIANRNRSSLEGLIGFFVNSLVLCIGLGARLTFEKLVDRVVTVALGAYAHQDLPFEQLVDELDIERNLSYTPLFQVMITLQNMPQEALELPDLRLSAVDTRDATAKFDLEIFIEEESDGGLVTIAEYSTELFDDSTIARVLGHFGTSLEAIVADPRAPVVELPFLRHGERHQMLTEWNDSGMEPPGDCVHELVTAQARRVPDSVAGVCDDSWLTYSRLDARAEALAGRLIDVGVEPAAPIALLASRGLDFLAAMLAAFKIGSAYLPLDPLHPTARLGQVLRSSGARWLLAAASLASRAAETVRDLEKPPTPTVLDLGTLLSAAGEARSRRRQATAVDLAYVIFTSGSTGLPKGAMVDHRGMVNHLYAKVSTLELGRQDVVAQTASQCFDISVWQFLAPLVAGGRVHIIRDEAARDPMRLLGEVERSGVTILETVPSLMRIMMEELERDGVANPDLSRLRWLVPTGEALPPELCHRWLRVYPAVPLLNAYGPTECSDDVTHYRLARSPAGATAHTPIGRPVTNLRLYVLDPRLRPVPLGVSGQLAVGGLGVGRGYLRDPRRTADVFVPDSYSPEAEERLYLTGDRARFLQDGNIEFLGRLDYQVKIRGFRIELGEIEATLARHPAVEQCVVVAQESAPGLPSLVAYVVETARAPEPDEPESPDAALWQMIFEDVYLQGDVSTQDTGINKGLWVSSYTGRALPEEEILEAVEDSVERILDLRPRQVLEIGCGTGLLLSRIAPHCESYLATDFSRAALNGIRERHPEGWGPAEVTLVQRAAHDFEGIPEESFDLIVINEVVQYFTGIAYLMSVLEQAIDRIRPGGAIFVGGVRNFRLLQAFHASVQLHVAPDSMPLEELEQRINERLSREKELTVDPHFFLALKRHLPRISDVRILIKGGQSRNELTKFRYDVVLRADGPRQVTSEAHWLDWQEDALDIEALRRLLEQESQALGLVRIPNARLRDEIRVLESLGRNECHETVSELKQALASSRDQESTLAPDPAQLWALAQQCGYRLILSWSDHGGPSCLDAVFYRADHDNGHIPVTLRPAEQMEPLPWSHYANRPLQRLKGQGRLPALRAFLKDRLPDHMTPARFIFLERFPLTQNGKVDRRALPMPVPLSGNEGIVPRTFQTPTEEMLAGAWSELLQIGSVGPQDNFFELGGHSLLATQLVSRLREIFGVEIPLRAVFEARTLRTFAQEVDRGRDGPASAPPMERVSRDKPPPLSFSQQRLWFIHQLDPQSPAYNVPAALRLGGKLSIPALERSLHELTQRHESLRTRFVFVDEQPIQLIEPEAPLKLPIIDLGGLLPRIREDRIPHLVTTEVHRAFDLAMGPLLRARLLRLGAEDHVIVFVMHHIISDGWSMGVLVREMMTLYKAFMAGEPSPLPELPIQYADFAHWQRRWLRGEVLRNQLNYWKQQLGGMLPMLEMPTDRTRPAVLRYEGARQSFFLREKVLSDLFELSRERGVTLFMTLLAGFQVLLYRYTGQRDLVIGTPVANRNRLEVEDLIGFFVNTLVLRTQLSGEQSFEQLLNQVREMAIQAYAHQDLPFEKLVDELALERNLAYSPLFQVMFMLQNAPLEDVSLPNLELSTVDFEILSARFDLELSLEESAGALFGFVNYNRDLFTATTVARLTRHYQMLIEDVVGSRARRLSELRILSSEETQQVLVEWADTRSVYPTGISVHQLFEAQVAKTPEAIAIVFEARQYTYFEVSYRAKKLARHLRKLGVRSDAPVGLCVERSPEMMIGILGILKAGGAYLPLDPSYPKDRLTFMLHDALRGGSSPVLLSQPGLFSSSPEPLLQRVCLTKKLPTTSRRLAEEPDFELSEEALVYVIYTSGSTGRPKGVMNTHVGVANRLLWMQDTFRLNESDRVLQKTPISFDVSVWELFWPLITGACQVIARPEGHKDPTYLVDLIASERITTLHFVPPMLGAFLEEPGLEHCCSLRRVIVSGEALPLETEQHFLSRLNVSLHNLYGPTEAAVDVSSWRCRPNEGRESVPIGRPVANCRLSLLDGHLRPVPVGVPGELAIGGVQVARGYRNRAGLTAGKFIPDQFSDIPGARLYKTGDLARYLPVGDIDFLGRVDHQVKIRGFRIELGEIEATLRQHPAVLEVVVVDREDTPGRRRLVGYLVARDGAPTSSVLAFLKSRLADYMIPSAFVLMDTLPLMPNGKVDRKSLPPPELDRIEEQKSAAPETWLERKLAEIWCDVLGLERVGAHENFFTLGGDSILGIQVIGRLGRMGAHLTLQQLFRHQTIAELAAVATEQMELTEQAPVTGTVPLTPIQHRFFTWRLRDSHHFNQALFLAVEEPLEPALLRRAVGSLVAHHDALRLRFSETAAGWRQEIPPSALEPFGRVDLRRLESAHRSAALETAAAQTQASLDLDRVLLRIISFDLEVESERVLMVFHHLVIDGVSWRILMTDLESVYRQLAAGEEPRLPPKTTSFKRFAELLEIWAESESLHAEMDHWRQATRDRSSLPVDFPSGKNTVTSSESVLVELPAEETRRLLREVPNAYRTQINDALLASLGTAIHRWAGYEAVIVDLEGHGREDFLEGVDLSRTVGWLTTIFPVCLEIGSADAGTIIKSVKEQLRAIPRRGLGYGLLRYGCGKVGGRQEFQSSPEVEVLFNYLGQVDRAVTKSSPFRLADESPGHSQSRRQLRPYLIEVTASVAKGRLQVGWTFSENLYRRSTIEKLARGFLEALSELITHCLSSAAGGYTPSDFPLAHLTQESIDLLVSKDALVEDVYPLTPLQEGLLFHALLELGSSAYLEQESCTIAGPLNVGAFKQAWQDVLRRHPALRTAFVWEGIDRPLQIVSRELELPWQFIDWRWLPSAKQEQVLSRFLFDDRYRGLNVSRAPVMRLTLIWLADNSFHLTWTYHHLLIDGWSRALLFQEFNEIYIAYVEAKQPEVVRPRPFRDYIEWIENQDLEEAERFWRRQLEGFAAPTPLKIGRERLEALERSTPHAEVSTMISEEHTKALEHLIQKHQITLNTLLQGLWALVLAHRSGDRDVVFGAVSSGRQPDISGIEKMVGLFINTLPVRVRIKEDEELFSWLRELQFQEAKARQFEHAPLVQIHKWSDIPPGQRLFESYLVFDNFPDQPTRSDGEAGDLEIHELRYVIQHNYQLALVVGPGSSLDLKLNYGEGCCDRAEVTAMLNQLRQLLDAVQMLPESQVGHLLNGMAQDDRRERTQAMAAAHVVGAEKLRAVRRRVAESREKGAS